MYNDSSFTLYDLKIGDFESVLEDSRIDAEMMGYYPLALYSHKVHVIPEVLNRRVMSPISFRTESDAPGYTQFIPRDFNLEVAPSGAFEITHTELPLKVPLNVLSLYFYFDMVAGANAPSDEIVRFNLIQFRFKIENFEENTEIFFTLIVDIVFNVQNKVLDNFTNQIFVENELRLIVKHFLESESPQSSEFVFSITQNA